jgi:hypothetical protein
MPESIRIIPWLEGRCSFYAIERDGVCLADAFLEELDVEDPFAAKRLRAFLEMISNETHVRQVYLRPERPELRVFAMYNHKELVAEPYNRSRLLCSYVGQSNRLLLLGSGFIKLTDQPIQRNGLANREAEFLYDIARKVGQRIECGEILVIGSELVPLSNDSFDF